MNTLIQNYQEHQGKLTDKWEIYLRKYDELFAPFRGKAIRMLEIGIQNGGSLEVWSEYFPEAQLFVGCDINPNCVELSYDDSRIRVVIGDAGSAQVHENIIEFSEQFDIVIDDGSHKSSDIVRAFALYFPHVVNGGIFLAEDLHCSYWKDFEGGLFDPYSSIAFFKRLADIINHEHWGVEKTRLELLNGFRARYGIDFSESDLERIHSVEFFNSVCVVRKKEKELNLLGRRYVVGDEELVTSEHLGRHLSGKETFCQTDNTWSNRATPPEELVEQLEARNEELAILAGQERAAASELSSKLAKREMDIERLAHALLSIEASTSWAITSPLRKMKKILDRRVLLRGKKKSGKASGCNKQSASFENAHAEGERSVPILTHNKNSQWERIASSAQRFKGSLGSAVRISGGVWPTCKRAIRVLRSEGLEGLRKRLQFASSVSQRLVARSGGAPHCGFVMFDNTDPNVLIGSPVLQDDHYAIEIPRNRTFAGTPPEPLSPSQVGFFIHAFYAELIEDLLDLVLPGAEGAHFFVTTDNEEKADSIRTLMDRRGIGQATIRVVPNRGRDMAPRFVWLKNEIRSVEYAVFLHTKKSKHIQAGNEWRDYLWSELVGTTSLIANILATFAANPALGMLAPYHWPELTKHQPLNWGYNFPAVQLLLDSLGGALYATTPLDFPSGSMYWVRTQALSGFLDLDLQIEQFEEELGQVDGTMAHVIERSLFFICELAGYEWAKYTSARIQQEVGVPDLAGKTIRLLGNDKRDFSVVSAYPETQPILFKRCSSPHGRINLLIPTLRKSQVFGGIKTAVTLFASIGRALAADGNLKLRVVVTDDIYVDHPDFLDVSDFVSDRIRREDVEILSFAPRPHYLIEGVGISQGDVFFASAWWNARECRRLQRAQQALHGACLPVVYFLQDYEPGFYAWSSKSALADSTYDDELPSVFVVNDHFLLTHFTERGLKDCLVLPFGANDSIYNALIGSDEVSRENLLIFYGRPSVLRNCFELVIDAIGEWALADPYGFRQWRVVSVGEEYSPELIPEYLRDRIDIVGKLDLHAYAMLLKTARVGVSVMQSPHPSYPPQEMAMAGMAVVTNEWEHKKWAGRPGTIFSAKKMTPADLAECIRRAVGSDVKAFDPEFLMSFARQSEVNADVAGQVAHTLRGHMYS